MTQGIINKGAQIVLRRIMSRKLGNKKQKKYKSKLPHNITVFQEP
jgi:hypothetical protein